MPVFLIRHGQSEFNAAYNGGDTDPMIFDAPLTDKGRRELLIHSCDVGRHPAELQRDFPTLSFTHLADCWWHQGPQNDDGIAVEPEDVFLQRMAKFAQGLTQVKERPLAIVGHGNAFHALIGRTLDNCEIHHYQPD
jgi:broad specificity phosphatase PhoE